MLRYATLKNLGELEGKHGTKEEGLKYLLEALDIDRDDMMVWFRAGIIARELGQLHIAQLAFAQAVKILPSHWFSIENYVEVLYLVGDFEAAAFVINNYAFRLDPDWTKGHALLAQINREDHALYVYFSLSMLKWRRFDCKNSCCVLCF
jgi:tetratricopeptide (TPR) repeat protein